MKDSEILRDLIRLAYDCDSTVEITLADCLDFYARVVASEVRMEPALVTPGPRTQKRVAADRRPEPVEPGKPQIGGRGSTEKRAIYEKLKAYREKHGLGSYAPLAKASNRALSEDTIRDMATGEGTFPLSKWKVLEAAIDYCEGKEAGGDDPV